MATRDTSSGGPTLDDHILRLDDLTDATVAAPVLSRLNHTDTQTLSTISDVPANPIAAYSVWSGTQAAYDLLTPDASTIYLIEAA